MNDFIVAVVATCRRPLELARLLGSLENAGNALGAVVVVDNGNETAIRKLVEAAACNARYFAPGENLGCGGGLRFGGEKAFEHFGRELTHLWILDDDAVVTTGAPEALADAMRNEKADAACPMITGARGEIGWFPGLLDPAKFRAIRDVETPGEFIAKCGNAPVPFSWSTGVALLVSKRAVEELGFHRADYWMRGEDLEFTLRITNRRGGIFVPGVIVQHIPPQSLHDESGCGSEYLRHAAMLQNLWYTGLRLPHGRRIARTLPGNYLRFLKTWSWRSTGDAIRAFWLGGVLGKPAGTEGGDYFRRRESEAKLLPMKLLVFAHTPPPHHGQSYMVKLMLDGLGGDHRGLAKAPEEARAALDQPAAHIECYHVNAQLS